MKHVKDKEAMTVAAAVEQTWLIRYPWPTQVVFDKGKEFMGDFAAMMTNDYGIEQVQGYNSEKPSSQCSARTHTSNTGQHHMDIPTPR